MATPPHFADALALFLDHEVELIVVGGVAAVLGGAPVNTLDLDLLIEASSANIERVVAALRAAEALYRDPAGRRIEPSVERFSARGQHRFTTRYGEIDVLASIGRGATTTCGPGAERSRSAAVTCGCSTWRR